MPPNSLTLAKRPVALVTRSPLPELDCVRGRVPAIAIQSAEDRARRVGVSAERCLIATGAIDEERYMRALSVSLGVPFEPLDGILRVQCPDADNRLIVRAANGLLLLSAEDEKDTLVVAPANARGVIALLLSNPAWIPRLCITTRERLVRFVVQAAGKALTKAASDDLNKQWPGLSAAPPLWRGFPFLAAGVVLAVIGCLLPPDLVLASAEVLLAVLFLTWLGLRVMTVFVVDGQAAPAPVERDGALPMYSVIVALRGEAKVVNQLIGSLERLDYPREKLDVIFALEADDPDTHAAVAARKTCLPLTVISVPAAAPRTKPKALNAALPFARGIFTVIYDAEDRPEPNQLRRALQAFRRGHPKLACVQARLTIDNTRDGWLARLFTAEYAGQFDVFLPGLAAMRLPLPLGGSSNHFRTDVLRKAGAWDAYNVTEDADLGMRLARLGYRCGVIDSATIEEAPAQLGCWLRQRTRWFKGWMQTWLVHMRHPLRLARELGPAGFITFQLVVGGNALAALVHPPCLAGFLYAAALAATPWHSDGMVGALLVALYGSSLIIGYATSACLGWLGLYRRGLAGIPWVLLATPLHWLLLSLAAWRAVYQLVRQPYLWEKTEHGLARTSRRADGTTQVLLKLERELTLMQERGELPVVNDVSRGKAARKAA